MLFKLAGAASVPTSTKEKYDGRTFVFGGNMSFGRKDVEIKIIAGGMFVDFGFSAGVTKQIPLQEIAEADVAWKEQDPDDILDLCKDMFDKLEGKKVSRECRELQERVADKYWSHNDHYRLSAKVGPRFLIKYRRLFFPEDFSDGIG